MSETVFVDASAWVALTNGKDRFHEDALRAFRDELFWQYKDKDWGVVDCASLVVMDEGGCNQAFAFDRHFMEASQQYGFSLVKE